MDFGNVLQNKDSGKRGQPLVPWPLLAVAAAAVVGVVVLVLQPWVQPQRPPRAAPLVLRPKVAAPPPAVPPFHRLVYPTPQTNLLSHDGTRIFQPTVSGRPESGRYGSVRPGRFHEGIDIAATSRDRRSRPLDPVCAVAPGIVGHINRIAGNSNYGIYIVLIHDDPIGQVYTLYAHLSEVSTGLAVGQRIEAGSVIGRMGNTPSSIIPVARSHLHFEIGLIANSRFQEWFIRRRLKPDHGTYNGWNLLAIDPLGVFAAQRLDPEFSLRAHISSVPHAFEMVVTTPKQLDFFRRYPSLWAGPAFTNGAVVLACTANGVPLTGRSATAEEKNSLRGKRALVLKVDGDALGANGLHLVERDGRNGWKPGINSDHWLDILTY